MDDWVELESKATDVIARLIRPLIDTHLSVVFYDLTTIEASGESEVKDDLRAHGRSKRDRIERQLASGLVQTAEGLPIANEIFEGNVAEVSTLRLMVEGVLERFDIKRVVLVADRGLLLMDNLEALGKIRLPSDCPLKFVPAVPARRDRIRTLEDEATRWVPKLDAQHQDSHSHGRKLSCSGAKARLVHAVAEAHRGSILQLDLRSHLLTWDIHRAALKRHETLDGKLVLLTNTPDLSADEVVECFMSQADIERGFRVLKSEIGISPLFHRSPDRIRLHACICFLALVLHRVVRMRVRLRVRMRVRLRKADAGLSSASSLGVLHQIQRHRISLNDTRVVRGLCASMTSRRASQRVNNRA